MKKFNKLHKLRKTNSIIKVDAQEKASGVISGIAEITEKVADIPVEQAWPGLLNSADRLLVPIIARDKLVNSSEEFVEFPDITLDGFHIKEGMALLASIRGDLKRYTGSLRQDSALVDLVSYQNNTKYVMLVLADGLGSKKMSHLASRAAVVSCRKTARIISPPDEANWATIASQIFENAVLAIEDIGIENSIQSSDLLTTLTVAFIALEDLEMQTIFLASVGNCRSLGIVSGQIVELEKKIDSSGPVASPKTKALPINVAEMEVTITQIQNDGICCILSDGAVEVVNQGIDFAKLVNSEDLDLHKLGWAIDVRAAGRTDDRTVVMWRPW